jgi:hypothetical protein
METVYAIHTPRPDGTITTAYFSTLAATRDIAEAWRRRGYAPQIEQVQIPSVLRPESPRARSERLMAEELATKTDTDLVLLANAYARELAATYDATDRAHTATDLRLVAAEMERRYY